MSATVVGRHAPIGAGATRWLTRAWQSPVARAFAASRLLVLMAGAAGAGDRRVAMWAAFDPALASLHMGRVGNVLGAAAVRWDAIHYLAIAAHGYRVSGDVVFFPLYPALMHAVGTVLGSDALAGMAVSLASFAVALKLLAALTELELGPRAARATVVLIAFAPLSFFFSAVYTESLFLALSVGCLYAARTGRWRLAVGLGACASLTRVPGVLLALPLLALAWDQTPEWRRRMAALAVLPGALTLFLAFLAVRGFGPLAPYLGQIGQDHSHVNAGPIGSLIRAVQAAARGLGWITSGVETVYRPSITGPLSIGAESLVLLGSLCLDVVLLRAVWRRLPLAYAAYSAALLLLCIWSPVAGQPLTSLDRYALAIFPLWMAAGAWLSERERTRVLVTGASAALLAFYTFQFATWAFIA